MKTNIVLVGIFFSLFMLVGCNNRVTRRCVSFAELEKRPPFTATVDVIYISKVADTNLFLKDLSIIGIRTQSGEKICIGDPVSEALQMAGFARTLQKGNSYEFPKTWLNYQARAGGAGVKP
jgi:hypothetical protein